MRREVFRSPNFLRKAKRWIKRHPNTLGDLHATLVALEDDAFQPSLQEHKLSGKWEGSYSCSAGYNLRIIFELLTRNGTDVINLVTLGTHDQLY